MLLIKHYDLILDYHEGKADMMVLSRKCMHSLNVALLLPRDLFEEFWKLEIEVVPQGSVRL